MPDFTPEEKDRWRRSQRGDYEERAPLQAVPEDGKLKPLFVIESRPSSINGIQFWAVLSYKDHSFSLPLPVDFMGMDEMGQSFALAPVAEKLRAQLAPILIAEDLADAGPLE